jgi:hypothetical protein
MKIHVGFNPNLHQVWVGSKPSDLSHKFGREYVALQQHAPTELENFLKVNADMADYFCKGFAYWVICRAFGVEERQGQYGLLKRRLKQFNKKLFRAVRSLADRVAREIKKRF